MDVQRDALVAQTLYRFAEGIDLRDWELLRSVFTDKLTVDYTSYRGGEPIEMTADDWVAKAQRRFATMVATQHSMTNPRVEDDGDVAACRMYVEAHHVAVVDGVEEHCRIGGEYRNVLELIDGRWLVSTLQLNVRWLQGNRDVLNLPVE